MDEQIFLFQTFFEQLKWYDVNALSSLGFKFGINIIMTIAVIRGIYQSNQRNGEFAFTYYIFNILIFFLCHLMTHVDLSIGFAFGLFALFSIMRYRTLTIHITDMTYLFAVVCIAVINSIYSPQISVLELLLVNIGIVLSIFILEKSILHNKQHSQRILYEKIELLHKDKKDEMIKDIEARTGLNIVRHEVESINFLNDTAYVIVYHY